MISNRALLTTGLALALVIGVAAVFLASASPDGLESAVSATGGGHGPAGAASGSSGYSAPFADYTLGGSKLADAGLIAAGTLVALVAVLGIGRGLRAMSRSP